MLELKEITKTYTTGDFTQIALDKVNLKFRKSEFAAILGPSGSGKTTLLNVIGGLDKYDSGDLIINGASTKKFKDRDWDAYRNNSVGFIFQSYNLIGHLGILDNVEMGMTLSGISADERKKKALDALKRVGLEDHANKKPNQLSGGQMQRVAIARALANDPDIILADEPTGALDTNTSKQIMELIKEIAKDKLVIMVTHNPELAEKYASRIIHFQDGHIINDNAPVNEEETINSDYKLKKTSMSFLTALKLSGKNIMTKKWRTGLTAFASSIGIIGIALILSLSNGFNKQIDSYEKSTLSNFPITISTTATDLSSMTSNKSSSTTNTNDSGKFPKNKEIYPYNPTNSSTHINNLTQKYVDYVSKIDKNLLDGISYSRSVNMNILKKQDGKATSVNLQNANFTSYPVKPGDTSSSYLKEYYDLLSGSLPSNKNDIVLVVDKDNNVDKSTLEALGLDYNKKSINFNNIVGKEYKLLLNNDYYKKYGNIFTPNGNPSDLSNLYDNSNAVTLKITGIVRIKKDSNTSSLSSGIAYSDELAKFFIDNAQTSDIVKTQQNSNYNVLTGQIFASEIQSSSIQGGQMGAGPMNHATVSTQTKDNVLESLGSNSIPTSISLYPANFDSKGKITNYLDNWNKGLKDTDKIKYTDMSATVTSLSKNIMNSITLVLIAFAAISLVVSLIMVAIITYISVLERTKEIGVLRAMGARKKDITRVFNAETFIIGLCSGILGITIAFLLTFPVNAVLYNVTNLSNVAQLNPVHAIALILISLVLTVLGGAIPAKMAAKKDPVEALRSE
ncbi:MULTISPECIES: ABC transporter ATP-binding protein/permease [Clostridium]|uniref:ABC transporter ATP-binding protein/permease n=1 Tax=Clostridium TaxID=1485 RepID=UPI0008250E6B|nr:MULTISPECIES: ABC transporter ATP-binding protein/permease [Clostridium]PJI08226.1 sulfate ABC transporter ATP-binding protein [Clostridium sp. CT7]